MPVSLLLFLKRGWQIVIVSDLDCRHLQQQRESDRIARDIGHKAYQNVAEKEYISICSNDKERYGVGFANENISTKSAHGNMVALFKLFMNKLKY